MRGLVTLFITGLAASAPLALAQTPAPLRAGTVIEGEVRTENRPLPNAQVSVTGTRLGATTNKHGRFRIVGVVEGNVSITARAMGYTPSTQQVTTAANTTVTANFELVASASTLNAVVTTGTLQQTYVMESPVKVEVITKSYLDRNVSNNLMDNLSFVPGLNQQIDCGVCFTNNIRINGMEGPYTAVLIDGTPMMSSLATVYGLNSVDPSLIEQIEIIKGPNSTLYGSEAMGGVINIVTKDLRFAPRLSLNGFTTSTGETSLDLAATPDIGGVRTLLSINGSYNNRFIDRNGDTFSDLPLVKRISVFNKWSLGTARPMDISARYYYEDRFGGPNAWTRADRGSSTVYGESIYTRRVEVLGSYQLGSAVSPVRMDMAFNWHDQNSYYGDAPYMGTQTVAFGQLFWAPKVGSHGLGFGVTMRHHRYRDSTAHHETKENRFIPGVFVQDEVSLSRNIMLLAGLRVDRHAVHGFIPSPRVALKWNPDHHTTLRLNAATGFRVVNLFTEDHAALTGARDVRIDGTLDPERSVTVTANLNRVFDVRGIPDAMTLDVDAYYTRFTNRILPDYDVDPSLIVYRNLHGYAETHGVSIAMGYATVRQPLAANIGVTVQNAFTMEEGTRGAIPFSPRTQGVFTLSYKLARQRLTLDWTGRILSPMALPEFAGLPSRSPWFTEQHIQATKTLRTGVDTYVAVKNMFDYVQSNAIIDPTNPFGDTFDTARVYGPLQGRRVLVGMRYVLGR